jgi:hypothetical protein
LLTHWSQKLKTGIPVVLVGMSFGVVAQSSIYTCVDGKGRTITSDRPIVQCLDRAQREINPSGTVKRVLGPTLTAHERAAQERQALLAAAERARAEEEKRRDRALLLRYPNQGVHDTERALALAQIDDVIRAASKRTDELAMQRRAIDADLEFYKADIALAPAALKRRIAENDHSLEVQKRFIADQESEKQRVNRRFEEELVKLRDLWSLTNQAQGYISPATKR